MIVWSLVLVSSVGAAAIGTIAYAPELVDQFGYESYYSRIEPDGRRFMLERKRAEWLPGGTLRCIVVDVDGTRRAFEVEEITEPDGTEASPERRIQTALRGKVDAGTTLRD